MSIRKIWLAGVYKTKINLKNKQKSAKRKNIFDILLFQKNIRETYMKHASWRILKREENMCDERKRKSSNQ